MVILWLKIGKITDYISNNIPTHNIYQELDVGSSLADGKYIDTDFKHNSESIGP